MQTETSTLALNNSIELLSSLDELTKRTETNKYPVARNSKAFKFVRAAIINGNPDIRPNYVMGSGRFVSVQQHAWAVTCILNKLGLKYTTSNDAARGGKCGDKITIIF